MSCVFRGNRLLADEWSFYGSGVNFHWICATSDTVHRLLLLVQNFGFREKWEGCLEGMICEFKGSTDCLHLFECPVWTLENYQANIDPCFSWYGGNPGYIEICKPDFELSQCYLVWYFQKRDPCLCVVVLGFSFDQIKGTVLKYHNYTLYINNF